jgi:hypothetical protein
MGASNVIYEIGEIVAIGFTTGIITGTVVFIANWLLSSVMNILKISMKGD